MVKLKVRCWLWSQQSFYVNRISRPDMLTGSFSFASDTAGRIFRSRDSVRPHGNLPMFESLNIGRTISCTAARWWPPLWVRFVISRRISEIWFLTWKVTNLLFRTWFRVPEVSSTKARCPYSFSSNGMNAGDEQWPCVDARFLEFPFSFF
jgi:hypothetical protein